MRLKHINNGPDTQNITEGQLDYTSLGFPPWARTQAGQYFLDVNGKITFTVSGRRGILSIDKFKPIYDQFFAQDIAPEQAAKFTQSYGRVMHYDNSSDQDDEFEMYQDQDESRVTDENGTIKKNAGQISIDD